VEIIKKMSPQATLLISSAAALSTSLPFLSFFLFLLLFFFLCTSIGKSFTPGSFIDDDRAPGLTSTMGRFSALPQSGSAPSTALGTQ